MEVSGDAPAENSSANSCLQLSDITKLEWGNTSITKKSYVDEGFIAISAAGPDGRLEHFEWSGEGVVLSAIGARCGRCFFVSGKWTAIKNTIVIQGDPAKVNHKFLYYYLNDARKWKISGSGQPFITLKTARETTVPFPPLAVQDDIVAEIEKQFSRLDEAVANLKRVKANLNRYNAAVLKAAAEGRLVETEASIARREGRGYETGEQLLRRMLVDRKTNWAGKGKYVEPAMPDLGALPALPEGWIWATAEAVCDPVVDCHNKTAPYVNSGIPLVRTTNIRDGQLLMDGMRFVDQPTYEFWSRRCPPAPGDVLFTREAPMGEACIVPAGMTVCLGQRTMLMRPSPAITASFLLAALMSPVIGNLIDRVAVGSGVKHLRVGDVERLPIPLPPLAEQIRIVAELDRRLSVQSSVKAEVDANLQRSEALRQATLARAFVAAQ